jgi:hypothetical protein
MKKLQIYFLGFLIITGNVYAGKCIEIDNVMVSTIESGFNDKNQKLQPKSVYAVKSEDYKSVYFIAGKTENGEIGVWSSNSVKAGEGMIMAAETYSVAISVWPDARKSRAKLSMFDDGFSDSLHCSQNAAK